MLDLNSPPQLPDLPFQRFPVLPADPWLCRFMAQRDHRRGRPGPLPVHGSLDGKQSPSVSAMPERYTARPQEPLQRVDRPHAVSANETRTEEAGLGTPKSPHSRTCERPSEETMVVQGPLASLPRSSGFIPREEARDCQKGPLMIGKVDTAPTAEGQVVMPHQTQATSGGL